MYTVLFPIFHGLSQLPLKRVLILFFQPFHKRTLGIRGVSFYRPYAPLICPAVLSTKENVWAQACVYARIDGRPKDGQWRHENEHLQYSITSCSDTLVARSCIAPAAWQIMLSISTVGKSAHAQVSPPKVPLSLGVSGTNLIMVYWAPQLHIPNNISICTAVLHCLHA